MVAKSIRTYARNDLLRFPQPITKYQVLFKKCFKNGMIDYVCVYMRYIYIVYVYTGVHMCGFNH